MEDHSEKKKLIDDKLQDTYLDETRVPDELNAIGVEKNNKIKGNKIEESIILHYNFQILLFLLSLSVYILLPIAIVYFTINSLFYNFYLQKIWWLSIPCICLYLFVIFYSYFTRHKLIQKDCIQVYFLSFLYACSIAMLFVLGSLVHIQVCFTLSILLISCLTVLLILHCIDYLNDKNWIKLSIIYSIIFIIMITYLFIYTKNFVEFFIIIIASVLFFAYLTTSLKYLFIDFSKYESDLENLSTSVDYCYFGY